VKTLPLSDLVAGLPLFSGLPGDAVSATARCARNVNFAPGDLLLSEGAPADTLFLIRRGLVSIEVHVPGEGARIVDRIGPGRLVGWSWMFPPYLWHFDARAVGPVGAVAIDGATLRTQAESDHTFGFELMSRLAGMALERLHETRIRLLDLYAPPGPLQPQTLQPQTSKPPQPLSSQNPPPQTQAP
jgi:CRP-like cAMP-binding protein